MTMFRMTTKEPKRCRFVAPATKSTPFELSESLLLRKLDEINHVYTATERSASNEAFEAEDDGSIYEDAASSL